MSAIPTPVEVKVIAETNASTAQRYSGSIEPATKVDVSFKVGGYVRALGLNKTKAALGPGDHVEKGDVLAVLQESDYSARLQTAQSSLLEARASLRQAELDDQRSQKLLASKSISQAEADTMAVRLDVAKARVAGALSRVQEAKLALEDTVIRAPISGVVLKRIVEIGSLVGTGAPAFAIADTATVKVVFGAPDRLVEKLAIGAELAVEIPATADQLTAKITRIAASADRSSRVFDVEATIPNPKDTLKAGMIAALAIPEATKSARTLSLPLTAILRSKTDPRGFAVFVVDGTGEHGTARSTDVKLGEIVGNQVLVLEGIERGQRVVSMGATLLADGSEVRVIPSKEK